MSTMNTVKNVNSNNVFEELFEAFKYAHVFIPKALIVEAINNGFNETQIFHMALGAYAEVGHMGQKAAIAVFEERCSLYASGVKGG